MKIVRNPVMARLKGTSGNSKGERFFDLLSGTPRVRIAPGAPSARAVCAGFFMLSHNDYTQPAGDIHRLLRADASAA